MPPRTRPGRPARPARRSRRPPAPGPVRSTPDGAVTVTPSTIGHCPRGAPTKPRNGLRLSNRSITLAASNAPPSTTDSTPACRNHARVLEQAPPAWRSPGCPARRPPSSPAHRQGRPTPWPSWSSRRRSPSTSTRIASAGIAARASRPSPSTSRVGKRGIAARPPGRTSSACACGAEAKESAKASAATSPSPSVIDGWPAPSKDAPAFQATRPSWAAALKPTVPAARSASALTARRRDGGCRRRRTAPARAPPGPRAGRRGRGPPRPGSAAGRPGRGAGGPRASGTRPPSAWVTPRRRAVRPRPGRGCHRRRRRAWPSARRGSRGPRAGSAGLELAGRGPGRRGEQLAKSAPRADPSWRDPRGRTRRRAGRSRTGHSPAAARAAGRRRAGRRPVRPPASRRCGRW